MPWLRHRRCGRPRARPPRARPQRGGWLVVSDASPSRPLDASERPRPRKGERGRSCVARRDESWPQSTYPGSGKRARAIPRASAPAIAPLGDEAVPVPPSGAAERVLQPPPAPPFVRLPVVRTSDARASDTASLTSATGSTLSLRPGRQRSHPGRAGKRHTARPPVAVNLIGGRHRDAPTVTSAPTTRTVGALARRGPRTVEAWTPGRASSSRVTTAGPARCSPGSARRPAGAASCVSRESCRRGPADLRALARRGRPRAEVPRSALIDGPGAEWGGTCRGRQPERRPAAPLHSAAVQRGDHDPIKIPTRDVLRPRTATGEKQAGSPRGPWSLISHR